MERDVVIRILRENEPELRRMGVLRLSLFGSVARGEAGPASDVDVAINLDPENTPKGLDYIGLLEDIREKLSSSLGRAVDVIDERSAKKIIADLERDRIIAFQ